MKRFDSTSPMRLALAAVALVVALGSGLAAEPAPQKTLPPATEAAWVSAVQDMKTADGTTVLQALRYAEKLRPSKFKVGDFGAGYNGATGAAEVVVIDYWIGLKREDGDSFSIMFNVRDDAGKPVVTYPRTPGGFTAAEAVMTGRDGLLGFLDETYREDCIDNETGAKLC